ncbi:serine/threonine-protein kinase [Nocardiopsis ansamitocini]|uniref:non-specific serine/threonine protein kinase n=1 Tax=Nocardiopsis ansamitocini TaxID=1670832 RepID=A0A9W6P9Z9_9ACTN|nr:serine/threonine-protein kinase [Nocardiopsis ansamitocini]GLU49875.1 hypothetical protein Nans01_42260 [Nocardiopsis ansamitocini]
MSGNDASGGRPLTRAGSLLSNRYRLEEQIGAGGMGEVWRATDTLLSRPVAVKMLHTAQMGEPISRQRFRTEAQITAALSHAGIAQVYDYGEQDDTAFLVMELVPGESLSTIIKRNPGFDADTALDVLCQAAQALAAAHARGIVHRDIKPGNLLVTEEGSVKLTDFGIARGNESVTLTQTGMVMGTAQYISPEQVSGRPATQASDIYALGVVAYECLAGRPPFTADTPLALALMHTREAPPPLPESVPTSVRELVEWLLEKDPDARPGSAADVAQHAQRLRAGIDSTAATEALNLSGSAPTVLAGAVSGPITSPTTASSGSQTGRIASEQEWSPAAVDASDRVAEESAPSGRPSRSVVFALVATVAVVALGVVLVSALWRGNEPNGEMTGSNSPVSDTSPSVSPSPEEDPDPSGEVPAPGGGEAPVPNEPYVPAPQPSTPDTELPESQPETPPEPPVEETETEPEAPDGGGDNGEEGGGNPGGGGDAGNSGDGVNQGGNSRGFTLPMTR